MSRYMIIMLAALLPLSSSAEEVAAEKNGQQMHDENCIACHAGMTNNQPDTLYTRENRRVQDSQGLNNQVQRCALNLKLEWFDSEIQAVSDYLNQSYYHFEAEPSEPKPAAAQ